MIASSSTSARLWQSPDEAPRIPTWSTAVFSYSRFCIGQDRVTRCGTTTHGPRFSLAPQKARYTMTNGHCIPETKPDTRENEQKVRKTDKQPSKKQTVRRVAEATTPSRRTESP